MKRTHLLVMLSLLAGAALFPWSVDAQGREALVRPAYDAAGDLLLPQDFRTWVLVGSSLGMSYSEGGASGREMFHHTLIEPTAYDHYVTTGEFRDGTMLALLLHPTGEGVLPSRRGRFADALGSVEMAVKDSGRFAGGWAYFGFGSRDGLRPAAPAFDAEACASCHREHAAQDNVFVQFYPLLTAAARAGGSLAVAGDGATSASPSEADDDGRVVAIEGLDPVVLLTTGEEELGKAEIVEDHGAFRYQFVSEPSRRRFAEDPKRYAFQNRTCPVVPGAPVQSNLFAVHDGKLYGFASEGCIGEFLANPDEFLPLTD
ncbi:MAG: cytochrome P460 family protein [Acidobacteriota bacterium]